MVFMRAGMSHVHEKLPLRAVSRYYRQAFGTRLRLQFHHILIILNRPSYLICVP